MRAYLYETSSDDQRQAHDSGINKSVEDLNSVGVLYWHLDGNNAAEQLDAIAHQRNYKTRDQVVISPEAMGGLYEDKINMFFTEHLHEDEEIRFVNDGSGFFDVRDQSDMWIRIQVEKGDMLILPAGIYHRFTTDSKNYINLTRLFKDEPNWTPINRPLADHSGCRDNYLKTLNISTH